MIARLIDILFGCPHPADKLSSFPRGKWNGPKHRTYMECGKEVAFTAWDEPNLKEVSIERCEKEFLPETAA